jgi:flagellar hook-basal body complex protein FliE
MKEIDIQRITQSLNSLAPDRQQEAKPKGADFSAVLLDSLKEVNKLQVESNTSIQELAAGKKENIHETMIAIEKASISFQMMMQIRNKIIEAYDQLMKTSM